MVEDPAQIEIPEPVDAAHLDEARGHEPRDHNVIGAYARSHLVVIGVILAAFLILH